MPSHDLSASDAALSEFCRRHHIRRLALFGSVLRDRMTPESDIDVLVDFAPEHVPGFLRLHEMEEELREIFGGRRVDLVTRSSLNHRIRNQVLAEAQTRYAER